MKVQVLVPEYRTDEGAQVVAGDTVDLSDKEARRLVRRGYVAVSDEAEADEIAGVPIQVDAEPKSKTPANKARTPANKEA